MLLTYILRLPNGNISKSEIKELKKEKVHKLEILELAKRYNIPFVTAKKIWDYSDKFTKEEHEKMYICKKETTQGMVCYIRNENDNTIVFLNKLKFKKKPPKKSEEIEALENIINHKGFDDKTKNNMKIMTNVINAYKDYKFDDNNSADKGAKKQLEIIKGNVDYYNKNLKEYEEMETKVINKIIDKMVNNDDIDIAEYNIKIWENVFESVKDYKFDDTNTNDRKFKKAIEINKKIIDGYHEIKIMNELNKISKITINEDNKIEIIKKDEIVENEIVEEPTKN
jgi:hypothetical protein